LGPYEGLLRELVLRMKDSSGEGLAEALGRLWGGHTGPDLQELGIGAVVPVPLHWWRRWRRGYTQSDALAHALAGFLRLPCRPGWLRRVRNTEQPARADPRKVQ